LQFDEAKRMATVELEIRNDSTEAWRRADGFRVGYHLFDASTGTLIVDGPRVALPGDLEPGSSAVLSLQIPVPGEDGGYQVLISPMREGHCWYYEQGWPVLLLEASSVEGVTAVRPLRVATFAALRRKAAGRAMLRAFGYPVVTIWRNRSLIRTMVRRDILGRYRGSFGGVFWTVLNPLLLMATYFFVFGVVLRSRFGADSSKAGFALYFLAGMLPWLAFSEAAGRAPSVMLEHRNFVKKLVFAVETLPINLVVSGLVSQLFAIALYCLFLLAARHSIPLTILWLPVLLIPQILFTAGVSWFLAALGVFLRDLGQVIGFLLTLWFFLTPICYPETQLPQSAMLILSKNPIFVLVRGYRAIFLENQPPAFGSLWKLWVLSGIVFVLGHAWFYKLRKSFADIV
jgi:lipopolysaccharide transport system permease protein